MTHATKCHCMHCSFPVFVRRIGSLATTVMNLANAVVKQTEGQLDQSASTLQNILVSAADERGEWHLPLTQEQSQSMQQVICKSKVCFVTDLHMQMHLHV